MTPSDYRENILSLADKYHAHDIRLFGSALRGEETENSDIDILVNWDKKASLTDWAGLKRELEEMLGKKVDIASEQSLHWYIRDKILKEARPL